MLNLCLAWILLLAHQFTQVISLEGLEKAVLNADGKILDASGHRRASIMRRHQEGSPSSLGSEQPASFMDVRQTGMSKKEIDSFFQSLARPSFARASFSEASGARRASEKAKRKMSAAGDGDDNERAKTEAEHFENDPLWEEVHRAGGEDTHKPFEFTWPKEWLGDQMETLQKECSVTIGVDKGYSDYGAGNHTCNMCKKECNEGNHQPEVKNTWVIEPTLKDEPARAMHWYTKMENIDGLGCPHCMDWQEKDEEEIGISNNYEIDFSATKETKAVPDFKALVGTYVSTGTAPNFAGKLFFLVRDTVPPKNINGCKTNPPGRRYALQGASRGGELFYCQRFCTVSHEDGGCPCGFMDAIGCMVHVHVATGMMVRFALRLVAADAMAPMMGDDGTPKSLGGQQWEAVATFGHDDSDYKIDAVIGRVILTGNGQEEGIVSIAQNLHHKGCTPCDMFYSSFLSVGPFITSPADVHWVRSADVNPPPITDESCELFRVTAQQGHVLLLESGPGIWPVTQSEATLFTCPRPEGNQTR